MTEADPRRSSLSTYPAAFAMCQPAVRMAVVYCRAYEGVGGHVEVESEIIPVLAIVARRPVEDYSGQDVRIEAVVLTEGIVAVASDAFIYADTAYRVATCPWPPAEDDRRLIPVVADVSAEAIDSYRARIAKAASGEVAS